MTTIVFYVSGHGYGHAVRTACVLERLHQSKPDWRLLVRTRAPSFLFPSCAEVQYAAIDPLLAETPDTLGIDEKETSKLLLEYLPATEAVVASEAASLREARAHLIVADIPFLAGEIAVAAGLECLAIGNFTWNWIYEQILPDVLVLDRMRKAYAHMQTALRLPLHQPTGWNIFPRVIDVPLVCRKPEPSPRVSPLTTVFLAGRGGVQPEAIERARMDCGDEFHFVALSKAGSDDFLKLFHASDIVISKLGYGIGADCIAAGKRLVYPPRNGFREESILRADLARNVAALPISSPDYLSGDWGSALRAVELLPPPVPEFADNGADVCANIIIEHLK